jgi:flavin-dependent dehydrogenase
MIYSRRDFMKALAAGGSLFAFDPVYALAKGEEKIQPLSLPFDFIYNAPYQQAVWRDTDIVVIGSATGAVAAALSAAKAGARVFVVSSYPYPGEDICASFRFWPKERQGNSVLFRQLFPTTIAPYPLHVKSVLENELLAHGVEFVYSSFVSNVITDPQGRLAGVCVNNRSGQQLIRAKVLIDATHHASVARLAGVPFHPFKAGEQLFRFVVVGNKEANDPAIVRTRKIYPAFNVGGKSHTAWEYELKLPLQEDSYASLMEAEQKIRGITWDADQTDSADTPWYIPTSYMNSRLSCQPDGVSNLFVLGPCSAVRREDIDRFLEPSRYMEQGEDIGKKAAAVASGLSTTTALCIRPLVKKGVSEGGISFFSPFRSYPPLAMAHYAGGGIPVVGDYDVVVVGGGTAGAPAAISVARKGVKILVIEYLHGLGGIGTLGFIGRYTAGYRKGFTEEIDKAMQTMAPPQHPRHIKKDSSEWPLDWKAEWYRKEIRRAGGDIWFHTIACGVWKQEGCIRGIIVHTPFGEGIVRCKCVIDSTGSADIAIAAGSSFEYTGKDSLAIQGAGLGKFDPGDHYNNTDWTFVDDTDILDVTRLFIQGKMKNQGNYDIGKLPQTRERRRIIADYNVSVFDMMNHRTYRDTISYHKSNFDTHGFTEDIYFTIKPPEGHETSLEVKLPLRSLLPKGLENILVTGLGAGAHRDAMPIIRMQPDLQNQGYSAGIIAAESILQNKAIRRLDIRNIQRQLVEKGTLPADVLQEDDHYSIPISELQETIARIPDHYNGLEKILAFPEKAIPLLKKMYKKVPESERIYYANILCMLRTSIGWEIVLEQVKAFAHWDKGWNYRGMHQFGFSVSRLDNYVMALGYSGRKEVIPELLRLAGQLTPQSDFSHIRALSIAACLLASEAFKPILSRLLRAEGMTGYHLADGQEATEKIILNTIDSVYVLEDSLRNKSLKELYAAKALFLCGDDEGLAKQLLENYATGLEGHYARFAGEVLNHL